MGSYALAATNVDFMVHGLFQYEVFGQKLWITTTHVSLLIVMLILLVFGIVVKVKVSKVKPGDNPTGLISACEIIVEKLDDMVLSSMGEKQYRKFANYIGTIFGFIS